MPEHTRAVRPAVECSVAVWLGVLVCERERRVWEARAMAYGGSQSPAAVYARFMWWRCERNVQVMLTLRSGAPRP